MRIGVILLTLALGAGVQTAGAQSPEPPAATVALGAIDPARGAALVDRVVAALGGAAAIDGVKTLEVRGRSTRFLPGGAQMQVETATFLALPDRYRQETRMPGTTLATFTDGRAAFTVMGGQTVPLPEADAAALQGTARRNLVRLLQGRTQRGFGALWIGTAQLGAAKAQLVTVGPPDDATTLYVDEATSRVVRLSYGVRTGGAVQELLVDLGDYRPVGGGLLYPFTAEGLLAGKPAFRAVFAAVTVNSRLDDALFAAPAPAPKP